jgi:hypothetical protein
MRLIGAGEFSAFSYCDGERLHEEIAMSALCEHCKKWASARHAILLSSTWHTTVWSV